MNQDPLDQLDAFYADCRVAPVPERLVPSPPRRPWWGRFAVPMAGLAAGAAAAVAIVLFPSEPSAESGAKAAQALARRQIVPEPKPVSRPRAGMRRGGRWSV